MKFLHIFSKNFRLYRTYKNSLMKLLNAFWTLKTPNNSINNYTSDLFPNLEHPIVRCTNNKLMFVRHNSQVSHKVHVGVTMGGVSIRLSATGGRRGWGGRGGRGVGRLRGRSPYLPEHIHSLDDLRPKKENNGCPNLMVTFREGGREKERGRERVRGGESQSERLCTLTRSPAWCSWSAALVWWHSCTGRGHWGSTVARSGQFPPRGQWVSYRWYRDSTHEHSHADDAVHVQGKERRDKVKLVIVWDWL